ncbi:MAG: TIM barrel protein [Alphaproteobacteria bacterium]|jgi:sugar phosphate isomerase/epimerase|nr:TIM barrel protein [Alphaproteobacteria bacterium]
MQLALSVRIAEAPGRKDIAQVPIEDLAEMARTAGFEGLSMRASVVSVASAPERVAEVRQLLDRMGLHVSMVTGDLPLAVNDARATAALHDITPYLDLAEALGSRLLRVMMHEDGDITLARQAADAAAARGLALSHQTHWGSLFETVDEALDVLGQIDRSNFGVTFEPANLLACGSAYGPAAIRRLAPHIFNAYYQNLRLDPGGEATFKSRRRGPVPVRFLAIDDAAGIDPRPLVETLGEVGYDGWFTVHQPLLPGQSVEQAIGEAAMLFRPLLAD